MRTPLRGEVWLVDLGLAAKVRPALVLSVPAHDGFAAVFFGMREVLERGVETKLERLSTLAARVKKALAGEDPGRQGPGGSEPSHF